MRTVCDQFIKIAGEIKIGNINGKSTIEIDLNQNIRFPRVVKTLLKNKQRLLAHT